MTHATPAPLLAPLSGTALLRAAGGDRLEFVHGQVSSEVKGLKGGELSEGLLLNHKGHALAQLAVLRQPEAVLLAVDDGALELVRRQLEDHIVFDDVTLEVLPWRALTVQGEGAADAVAAALGEPPGPGRFAEASFAEGGVITRPSRRSAAGGYDLYGPAEPLEALEARLKAAGAQPADAAALELLRVLAGIPSAAREAGEGVLPQEAGLEPRVSYRKGCYLGQEIMARIEARGNVRRSLHGVRLEAWPPQGARDVLADGKVVGRLGTVAKHPDLGVLALAVLRRDLAPEAALEVGGRPARLAPLPFAPA